MYSVEYLPRLNQLSVEIEDAAFDAITGVGLEEEGRIITIAVKGQDPIKVKCPLAIERVSPLSLKVQNDRLLISLKTHSQMDMKVANDSCDGPDKWSCGWLNQRTSKTGSKNEFQFRCSNCQNQLIDSLEFIFKDMPGDYWYELMDFWHCHKPENKQPTDKNYGVLKPKDDKTIVIGSFYLLQIVNQSLKLKGDGDEAFYFCENCHQPVGDKFQNVIRLFKWKLSLTYTTGNGEAISTYDPLLYAVNLFVTKIQSSAVRKFVVDVEGEDNVYLWILNTDVDVTVNGRILPKCLKVWWFSGKITANAVNSYEHTEIPYKEVMDKLLAALRDNTINSSINVGSINYQVSYIPTIIPT
ncbi:hypothetical protein CANMA_001527 [Candida margitis]|uniref:uncharacterized protein n=1 Tax=Candida margitis TaxID=1775924 RepID=UPI002227ED9B|nr:uncharacterized protein CANMA_001527 [Candida margitis]KAI5969459.1 hypothetical protein CANMA_001527 [Candida margitis]